MSSWIGTFFEIFVYPCPMTTDKGRGIRKATGAANRFSQLVNEELRAELARKQISLRKLSELADISSGRLSQVLNSNLKPLNTNELDRICTALSLSPTVVIRNAEKALRAEQAAELTRELPDADYYNALASRADYGLAANRGTELTDEDYYS